MRNKRKRKKRKIKEKTNGTSKYLEGKKGKKEREIS